MGINKILDKNGNEVIEGSVVNIHQTVNGENLFVVVALDPLDIRYGRDLMHKYQYDKKELLEMREPCCDDPEIEVVGNIYIVKGDVLRYLEKIRANNKYL